MPRDMEKRRAWGRKRYHEKTRPGIIKRYQERVAKGICSNCGARPAIEGNLKCQKCTDTARKNSTVYARKMRDWTFEAYGGAVCVCCGETEKHFLTIDHMNNDGAEHRKQILSERGSNILYVWLHKNGYPPGFQVLCQNCNVGRFRNGGICPHLKSVENQK